MRVTAVESTTLPRVDQRLPEGAHLTLGAILGGR